MIEYNHTMSGLKYVVFTTYFHIRSLCVCVCVRVWVHRVKVLHILSGRPVLKMKYNITDLPLHCSPTLSSPSLSCSLPLSLCNTLAFSFLSSYSPSFFHQQAPSHKPLRWSQPEGGPAQRGTGAVPLMTYHDGSGHHVAVVTSVLKAKASF